MTPADSRLMALVEGKMSKSKLHKRSVTAGYYVTALTEWTPLQFCRGEQGDYGFFCGNTGTLFPTYAAARVALRAGLRYDAKHRADGDSPKWKLAICRLSTPPVTKPAP
jgi:hypothetical protein